MTTRTLIKEILAALLLAAVIFAPGVAASAQSPAPAANPVMHLPAIVNVAFVDELYPDVDGGMVVRLKDDKKTEISVARDRVKTLKDRLGI